MLYYFWIICSYHYYICPPIYIYRIRLQCDRHIIWVIVAMGPLCGSTNENKKKFHQWDTLDQKKKKKKFQSRLMRTPKSISFSAFSSFSIFVVSPHPPPTLSSSSAKTSEDFSTRTIDSCRRWSSLYSPLQWKTPSLRRSCCRFCANNFQISCSDI